MRWTPFWTLQYLRESPFFPAPASVEGVMNRDYKAHRAYFLRFGIGAALYSLAIVVSAFWSRSLQESLWRFAVSLLPMVGVSICVWALMRFAREADEMQVRKLFEGLILASAGTIFVSIAYGFLQHVGAPMLNWHWISGVWIVFYTIGMIRSAWRYR
ncbi:hypothetical protein HMPREF9056_00690 [Actinomyces sp. oral taxon 170 str. F0386]|nr:hypothetical protein HMPREF9056_00690 [Actinomyces sp. oral taxon 170 str. F0386]